MKIRRVATIATISILTLGPGLPAGTASAGVISAAPPLAAASCSPITEVVARKYAGPDTSVTVMMETQSCAPGQVDIRANGRNERASGKTDWAIAVKYSNSTCHAGGSGPAVHVVHPRVPVGGSQPTEWGFAESTSGYWWAEVSTTYSDGRHFTGKTSCVRRW